MAACICMCLLNSNVGNCGWWCQRLNIKKAIEQMPTAGITALNKPRIKTTEMCMCVCVPNYKGERRGSGCEISNYSNREEKRSQEQGKDSKGDRKRAGRSKEQRRSKESTTEGEKNVLAMLCWHDLIGWAVLADLSSCLPPIGASTSRVGVEG